jgi:hypothetical protein
LYVFGDLMAMSRTEKQRPQNQHIERALQKLGPVGGFLGRHDGSQSTLIRVDALLSLKLAESMERSASKKASERSWILGVPRA